jgi:hypothetical protein
VHLFPDDDHFPVQRSTWGKFGTYIACNQLNLLVQVVLKCFRNNGLSDLASEFKRCQGYIEEVFKLSFNEPDIAFCLLFVGHLTSHEDDYIINPFYKLLFQSFCRVLVESVLDLFPEHLDFFVNRYLQLSKLNFNVLNIVMTPMISGCVNWPLNCILLLYLFKLHVHVLEAALKTFEFLHVVHLFALQIASQVFNFYRHQFQSFLNSINLCSLITLRQLKPYFVNNLGKLDFRVINE